MAPALMFETREDGNYPGRHGGYGWLLLSAVLAGLLFPLTTRLAGLQDGDGLLTSIMSTDKLTWYFWGQDRFLNFIPGLTSVVQDSDLNLRAQLFLRAFFAYLAPLGILVFFKRSPRFLLLAVAISNTILVLCLGPYGLFSLYAQHNPAGTSLVLFGLAWPLLPARRRWRLALVLLLCFLAYAVNIALLIFSVPLLFFLLLLRPQQRNELIAFSTINLLAIGLAFAHSRIFGERSTVFSATPSLDGTLSAYLVLAQSIAPLCALLILLITWYCLRHARLTGKLELAALTLTAAMMVVVLANTTWVQNSEFNLRYFMTALILLATVASVIVSSFLLQLELKLRHLSALMLLCAGALLAGLHGFDRNYSELIQPHWRTPAKAVAALAVRDHAGLIIGDFWDVWPVVYEVHRQPSAAQNRAEPIFGATFRSHPMLPNILATTLDKGPQTALCLMRTASACVDQLRTFVQIPTGIKITVTQQETVQIGSQNWLRLRLRLDHEPVRK